MPPAWWAGVMRLGPCVALASTTPLEQVGPGSPKVHVVSASGTAHEAVAQWLLACMIAMTVCAHVVYTSLSQVKNLVENSLAHNTPSFVIGNSIHAVNGIRCFGPASRLLQKWGDAWRTYHARTRAA